MKKIFPYLSIAFFLIVLTFILTIANKVFQPETKAEKQQKLAYQAYQQLHNKEIGKPFLVDSVAYKVNDFTYLPQKDTMVLIVDLDINNLTNQSKLYTNVFFKLIGGDENKVYYPSQTPFTVFEKRIQKLKLIYHLPINVIPTMWCDLHLDSAKDSTQNSYVTFAKSFREGG